MIRIERVEVAVEMQRDRGTGRWILGTPKDVTVGGLSNEQALLPCTRSFMLRTEHWWNVQELANWKPDEKRGM